MNILDSNKWWGFTDGDWSLLVVGLTHNTNTYSQKTFIKRIDYYGHYGNQGRVNKYKDPYNFYSSSE